jgi:hypothetical protein
MCWEPFARNSLGKPEEGARALSDRFTTASRIYAMKCSPEDFWSMVRTPPAKSGQSLKRCAIRARSNETRRSHHHEVRADNT